jgi:hypothetical protein
MGDKEAFEAQREALRETTQPGRPTRHEGALRRYLAGMAYVESHPHPSTVAAKPDPADRSEEPD